MELKELSSIPVSQLTPAQLEARLKTLRSLKVKKDLGSAKPKPIKSNKDRRLVDLMKGLSPDDLAAIAKALENKEAK